MHSYSSSCTGAIEKRTTTNPTTGRPLLHGTRAFHVILMGSYTMKGLMRSVVWNRSMRIQCALNFSRPECALKRCQTVFSVKRPIVWFVIGFAASDQWPPHSFSQVLCSNHASFPVVGHTLALLLYFPAVSLCIHDTSEYSGFFPTSPCTHALHAVLFSNETCSNFLRSWVYLQNFSTTKVVWKLSCAKFKHVVILKREFPKLRYVRMYTTSNYQPDLRMLYIDFWLTVVITMEGS